MLCCPVGDARTAIAPQRNKQQPVEQAETMQSGTPNSYLLLHRALNTGNEEQQCPARRGTHKPLARMQSPQLLSDPDLKVGQVLSIYSVKLLLLSVIIHIR